MQWKTQLGSPNSGTCFSCSTCSHSPQIWHVPVEKCICPASGSRPETLFKTSTCTDLHDVVQQWAGLEQKMQLLQHLLRSHNSVLDSVMVQSRGLCSNCLGSNPVILALRPPVELIHLSVQFYFMSNVNNNITQLRGSLWGINWDISGKGLTST